MRKVLASRVLSGLVVSGLVLAALALSVLIAAPGGAQERPTPGAVMVIRVDSAITGGTTSYIRSALDRAVLAEAAVLVIQLDTPGGLLSATRDIVQDILNARVPVAVYTFPPGARAASAGTMLTLAAHVAAMAPATHIGAAHPVSIFGGNDNKVMGEKILNDTSAYVQAIAELRNRNVEWAISAVRESKSITSKQAKELKVIEIVAENLDDLIAQMDGMEVRMDKGTTVKLATKGRPIVDLDMSFSQSFVTNLSNPNLVFFLLALGVVGLYIEFSTPGLILPGVVGAISLLMALIAMQTLPISYGALGLILLGVALLVAETFVPSFGLLGFGGIAALLFGSLFLLDPGQTDLVVSRPMVFATVGTISLIALIIGRLLIRSLRSPPKSFQATMIGQTARVKSAIAADQPGSVLLNGELWKATATQPLEPGTAVVVEAVNGLELRVAPADEPAGGQTPTEATA